MATVDQTIRSVPGGPTWEIAYLYPNQGHWTADEYLALDTNHLIEFSDGNLEVLPMPTEDHQMIVAFLYETLKAFVVAGNLGKVLFSPLRIKLWEDKFREPDVVFMSAQNANRRGKQYWQGADLVMEVVSEDDPSRDLVKKREEYAKAEIAEYWIMDPRNSTITVLTLDESKNEYTEVGIHNTSETANSVLLSGFSVDVGQVFSQS